LVSKSLISESREWGVLMPEPNRVTQTAGFRGLIWPADIHSNFTGERVHVAAVCYRLKDDEPEFLLVRTRSGRWTFPKGGVDDDATHADAAAREAYEEAGVKGRIEDKPFHWYYHSKRERCKSSRSMVAVQAHLCEVKRLEQPKEDYRDPTWFSVDKARRRLRENRSPELAREVIEVVERALMRIRARSQRAA
jgi:8-oxo-dGTP pyrophosphatase MutT (NUDIX family)